MRLELENIKAVDTALAGFLATAGSLRPRCRGVLLVDGAILNELTSNPSCGLRKAWEKLLLQQSFGEYRNAAGKAARLPVTQALTGLAVIVHNRIFLDYEKSSSLKEAADRHDLALLERLPQPESESDIILSDLLISIYSHQRRVVSKNKELDKPGAALLQFSPFTALKSLDLALPEVLASLAPEYLTHWQAAAQADDSEPETGEWWSRVEKILSRPELAHRLKSGWLELSENRLSCVGIGLFFEELRHRGGYDDFILRFFEAYEFLQRTAAASVESEAEIDSFALLRLIESLLSAADSRTVSRRLNQAGNEYFLKFRSLLEIVAARGGIPGGVRHLSQNFCFRQLLPLVSLATITGGERRGAGSLTDFGRINFS